VVALVNVRDEHHDAARKLVPLFEQCRIITTEGVMLEIGNSLARSYREQAIASIYNLLAHRDCMIEWCNGLLLKESLEMYGKHADKTWGLVDCLSFVVMQKRRIHEALTNDQHFEQAGFVALMRDA
jgi:hypothetical protein